MCAIIAASHLHHSRFLLSPRLRSHFDPITPINTHSIRIVFEDINVDAKVKRATLNGRALISSLIGLIPVSDMGDHVGQEKDIFTMVRWLPTNIVGGGDCRGGRGRWRGG